MGICGHMFISLDKSAALDTVVLSIVYFLQASNYPNSSFSSRSQVTDQLTDWLSLSAAVTSGPVCYEQGDRVGHVLSDLATDGRTVPSKRGCLQVGLLTSLVYLCPCLLMTG